MAKPILSKPSGESGALPRAPQGPCRPLTRHMIPDCSQSGRKTEGVWGTIPQESGIGRRRRPEGVRARTARISSFPPVGSGAKPRTPEASRRSQLGMTFIKKVGNRVGKKLSKAKALTIFYRKGLIFMVRPARFELTAFGSGGQRSIRLSYGRTRFVLICRLASAVKGAPCVRHCLPALTRAGTNQNCCGA